MTDLHDLLDLATDRVEATGLSNGVLVEAGRRRRTRRAVVSSVAVVAVVAGLAVVARLDGGGSVEPMPAPPTRVVEPRFDPRGVADLPPASVPGLPAELDVPDLAPHVEDDPVEAAVLSIDDGADVLLLGTDGRWRCVVVPDRDQSDPVLSPDGSRVFVGTVTVDLASGRQTPARRMPPPYAGAAVPRLTAGADDWTVRQAAVLADGTVLLRIDPPRGDRWWLVQWNQVAGTFSLVTSVDSDPAKPASFATGLLAGRS